MDQEITDQDGAETRRFPPLLADDASHADMIKAINGLAVEEQLTRLAVQELCTRIEMALDKFDRANERKRG